MRTLLSVALITSFAGLAAAKPITIRDYRSLIGITNPQLSPNEKSVAFVKTAHDFKNDKDITTLCVVDLASKAIHTVTAPAENATSPRWSHDGSKIAFLKNNDDGTIAQICVVSSSGGSVKQITHVATGVQHFAWSPSGETFAFDSPDPVDIQGHDDIFDLGDDGYLTNSKPTPSHIWLVPSSGGKPRRLTHGTWSVMENPPPFAGTPTDPSWSPDGRYITFARQANADNSDTDLSQVAIVDVKSGDVKNVTSQTTYEYNPVFSDKMNAIAYIRPHDRPLGVMDAYAATLEGGEKNIASNLDRDCLTVNWLRNFDAVVVTANDGLLSTPILESFRGPVRYFKIGRRSVTDLTMGEDKMVFVASNGETPTELYYLPKLTSTPIQLTHLNEALRNYDFGRYYGFAWKTPDGEVNDGVLTYPVGYQEGHKYPLLVFIHGGPEAASLDEFLPGEGELLRHTMAGKGYFVFSPNYRGSDELGRKHEQGIFGNPGVGPASDILSGIDELVKEGLVDPNRITVAGHSYGGYLTCWLISHDHRWKSGSVLDGAVDWANEYNFSSDGNLAWTRDSLGGTPSDPATADLYKSGSPITYAGDITTPTLIISGTSDETVPITESYRLYHALKDHHVPVRFVGVPGAHHMPSDPVRYERFWQITEDWILAHDRT
ncbi:MAG TPA: S9 family peptidase [Fimbriimonadaceae bacterium]|jgi:dipeptidyl aminopeptidase/acylaminoacyl peptidase